MATITTDTFLDGGVAAIQDDILVETDLIRAKTDNLPTDPTSTADLNIVNENVQRASLLVPATQDI